jgi:hypothetical protein
MKICSECNIEKDESEFRKIEVVKGTLHKICKKCHKVKYQTNKEALNEKRRLKYKNNSEDILEHGRKYHSNNKESIRERKRLYRISKREAINERARNKYKTNPEPKKKSASTWQKNNPDKHSASNSRRRADKLNQTPKWSNLKETALFHKEATMITKETGIRYSVDHKVPLRHPYVSGFDTPANLEVITLEANIKKGNRWWPDMPDYSQVIYDPKSNTLIDKQRMRQGETDNGCR